MKKNAPKDRLPPHSPDAERGVLGCLLLEPTMAWDTCYEAALDLDWFYDLRHQVVFNAMGAVLRERQSLDTITLYTWLNDHGQLEQAGGQAFLMGLPESVPSAAHLSSYLEILHEKFTARSLLKACTEAVLTVWDQEAVPGQALVALEKKVLALSEQHSGVQEIRLRQVIPAVIEDLENYHRGHAQIRGLTTGIEYVDKLLCGLGGRQGNYIVISGRPGTGKTSLAMQIALHVALDYVHFEPVLVNGQPVLEEGKPQLRALKGVPVAIFTLEMATNALAHRMLFQRSRADMQRWRNGFAENEDLPKLTATALELNKCEHLFMDDTGRCTIDSLRAKARRLYRQHGIKLFIIDYIQLLRTAGRRFREDRVQELSEISAEIANLGKELQVPFIVLAQMNRDYEKDPNRPPRLADLKDCGSIEQDADLVGFLFTPKKAENEHYEAVMNAVYGNDWSKYPKRVDCYWAKNRYGPTGFTQLLFQKSSTLFHDWNLWLKEHGEKKPAAGEPSYHEHEPLPTNEELEL